MASISSMKIMAGLFFSASSKALRKLLSLSPAILLIISGPLMRKKNAPVSFATARAISVFTSSTFNPSKCKPFLFRVAQTWGCHVEVWCRWIWRAEDDVEGAPPALEFEPFACDSRQCRRSQRHSSCFPRLLVWLDLLHSEWRCLGRPTPQRGESAIRNKKSRHTMQ